MTDVPFKTSLNMSTQRREKLVSISDKIVKEINT